MSFRVLAPKRERVTVVLETDRDRSVPLRREAGGWFTGFADGVRAGALYRLRLDDRGELFPDPASRFQPRGPHGPSEIVDPSTFRWTDEAWRGVSLRGQVLYELHVGTFTKEGTFAAAARELEELRDAGITLVELMPVAEFDGAFGWGYDGVDPYAPFHGYGRPDDLRAFVDRAHALGVGVILDVVYNHVGPSGNYLAQFCDAYFTKKYDNEWGDAIDFETDPGVRSFFVENAAYWVDEFHFDGLRLDATQSLHDASEVHVVAEIAERARAAARGRSVVVIAENEPQDASLARPRARGGFGLDAIWNDDFHHAAHVAMTGHAEAYYSSTRGTPQELVSAVKWGFLFQGQYYPWQDKPRGRPALDLAPPSFVVYLENHDQAANSAWGRRLTALTTAGRARAMTALLLLGPGTPLLFQGQEFGASAPFRYFADHAPELARLVEDGRRAFLAQFPSLRDPAVATRAPAACDARTFEACKLDLGERERHRAIYDLHRDLLRLRRDDPVFSAQRADWLHGAVLGPEAFVLRFGVGAPDERLLLVNLGGEVDLARAAEPLLAPPVGRRWSVLLSTEDPRYDGAGTPPIDALGRFVLPAHAAVVLAPSENPERTDEVP